MSRIHARRFCCACSFSGAFDSVDRALGFAPIRTPDSFIRPASSRPIRVTIPCASCRQPFHSVASRIADEIRLLKERAWRYPEQEERLGFILGGGT